MVAPIKQAKIAVVNFFLIISYSFPPYLLSKTVIYL